MQKSRWLVFISLSGRSGESVVERAKRMREERLLAVILHSA